MTKRIGIVFVQDRSRIDVDNEGGVFFNAGPGLHRKYAGPTQKKERKRQRSSQHDANPSIRPKNAGGLLDCPSAAGSPYWLPAVCPARH